MRNLMLVAIPVPSAVSTACGVNPAMKKMTPVAPVFGPASGLAPPPLPAVPPRPPDPALPPVAPPAPPAAPPDPLEPPALVVEDPAVASPPLPPVPAPDPVVVL